MKNFLGEVGKALLFTFLLACVACSLVIISAVIAP